MAFMPHGKRRVRQLQRFRLSRSLTPGAVAVSALAAGLAAGLLLVAAPEALAAAGNDVGRNLGGLLRDYATQLYGGIVAIVSLVFLINRRYVELGMFLLAAVVVGWMVFSPDQVAHAARGIGERILR
jgi:hypothetical protein